MNEHQLQSAFFDYVRTMAKVDRRYAWAHSIPNGTFVRGTDSERAKIINKMKAEGLTPGVSDCFIPWPNKLYHGLYLEFKASRKKSASPEQKAFILEMRERGYLAGVIYSLDDAIALIQNYMVSFTT